MALFFQVRYDELELSAVDSACYLSFYAYIYIYIYITLCVSLFLAVFLNTLGHNVSNEHLVEKKTETMRDAAPIHFNSWSQSISRNLLNARQPFARKTQGSPWNSQILHTNHCCQYVDQFATNRFLYSIFRLTVPGAWRGCPN